MLRSVWRAVWPWSSPTQSGPVVSVIELSGVLRKPQSRQGAITSGSIWFDNVKRAADQAFEAKGLQAVALNVNCPGGSPAQSELIAAYIRSKAARTNVPVLAFANDVAASGGYWLMCAGDELYACNTSLVGSIGVVGNSFGVVEAMKRLGVERRLAFAGESKVSSDPFSEETPEQRALKEEIMGSLHRTFIEFVQGRRGSALADAEQNALFTGKAWTGRDAARLGLVDDVGTLHEVTQKKFGSDVRLVPFGKPATSWWLPQASARSWLGGLGREELLAGGMGAAAVHAFVDAAADAVQTRSMWAKYGL